MNSSKNDLHIDLYIDLNELTESFKSFVPRETKEDVFDFFVYDIPYFVDEELEFDIPGVLFGEGESIDEGFDHWFLDKGDDIIYFDQPEWIIPVQEDIYMVKERRLRHRQKGAKRNVSIFTMSF